MIALVRADDVRIISDERGGWISVPDVKFPPRVQWSAFASKDQGIPNFQIAFQHTDEDGQDVTVNTLWLGPYDFNGQKFYVVDAPKRVLQRLRNQLGVNNVMPFRRALELRPALRPWARSIGFEPIRNSRGRIVGFRSPMVFAGQDGADLGLDEDQEIDDLPEWDDQ